jgi:glucose-6-phosphate 1-dehydrogenase
MTASHSDALVLFGVTGDLAHKMIFPALYAMVKRGTLKVPIIGVALPKWSLARLHKRVTESIERSGGRQPACPSSSSVPTQVREREL